MSKTNGTTKTATFLSWIADLGDEICPMGEDFGAAHRAGDGCVLAETTKGLVAWDNGYSQALPGDKVVLRKGAARSNGRMPWVMTGRA